MEKKSIKNLEVHKSDGSVDSMDEDKLYQVLESLPKPDVKMKLSENQKYWWYFFGLEFVSTKQLSKLDLVHLQKASFWMDARCKAIHYSRKEGYINGLVQVFKTGATNVSAHVSIIEKADKHLDEVSSHFGLSIKDRQKLKVEKQGTNQLSLLLEEFIQPKKAQ